MFALRAAFVLIPSLAFAAPEAAQLQRGGELFAAKCALCHQYNGSGAPPVYPPLAGSDWIKGEPERVIKVVCEGLEGPIQVNGQPFTNVMPAQILDDQQVADVLNYVGNSWGNAAASINAEDVRKARSKTRFKTYDDLVKASAFQPLPKPPPGWSVRTVVELPELCTRLATGGDGERVYALAQKATIYLLDPASHALQPIIRATDYLGDKPRDLTALGMAESKDGRLYFVTDERITEGVEFIQNEVTIWRTSAPGNGMPAKPEPWLRVRYPWGVGPYNHGVSGMSFGPDGALYVNSGSRTDGGESGNDRRFFSGGETELTACIWRIDPAAESPHVEVFARGVRNAWGLAFGEAGQLFSVSNGPDANAPEEMDLIERGKHYGFPFQFSDWPAKAGSPYPHTPAAPPGLEFTLPLENFGPAAGGSVEKPMATFDPHSSPGGFIWCGDDWPQPLRRTFLITRFGNLLGAPAAPVDVGFDLIAAQPERGSDGKLRLHTRTVLAPLGRPLDIVRTGPGRALILEYTRPTNFRDKLGWLPGRIIELSAPAS